MIVAIEVTGTRTYLAGDPAKSEVTFGHAINVRTDHPRLQQELTGGGWPERKHRDLGNAGFVLAFSQIRKFDEYYLAESFFLKPGLPNKGTLIVLMPKGDGTAAVLTADNAVVSYAGEAKSGVSVTMGFTIKSGPLSDAEDEDLITHDLVTDDNGNYVTDDNGDRIADDS